MSKGGRDPDCRLSFVVAGRNDDHGGRMVWRFQAFAESLLEQANKHRLPGELVVVEWNPPPGPRLHEVVKLRTQSEVFTVRFIEVPPEVHASIRNSDVIPLFQMIAKNVGIRRANGQFVLATNPDLLFSNALMVFLASAQLEHDVMYRIDRYDVPADVPVDASLDEQLTWCAEHMLRVHRRRGSFPAARRILWSLWHLRLAAWRELVRAGIGYWPRRITRDALRLSLQLLDPLPKVHTNGCGDFTMLSRDRWFALRGYPELPLWSMHVDALLCYMAIASGIRERVLRPPARIFHLEHQSSWVVMSPEERLKTFALKPWIDLDLLNKLWEHMYKTRRPAEVNTENWGLAELTLDEVVLRSGQMRYIGQGTPLARRGRG